MMLGYDLLKSYIDTESELRKAEHATDLQKEMIFSRIYSQRAFASEGHYGSSSLRVEDAALELIEIDQSNEIKYKRHYETRKLLNELVQTLDDKQKEVYNAVVWNKPTNIDKKELIKVGNQMTKDFCNYIVENHL